jgi:hypothetical protein
MELPRPGERFAGTTITAPIASGGMGIVFRARDDAGRDVALKVVRPELLDAELAARFRREGEALALVARHPNVVVVHRAGVERGIHYLVLELVEGASLRVGKPWPIAGAVGLVAKLARAVAHLHATGVLHRDLKPANVLLRPDGEPVIADFGLARVEDQERLTRTGEALGTPAYMAPEQAMGAALDERSDVHALGAILFELLTGEPAFSGATPLVVLKAVTALARPSARALRAEVSLALDGVVARALARDAANRTPSARALADELEAVLSGRAPVAPSRRPWIAGGVAAALVTAGVLVLTPPLPPAPPPTAPAPAPSPPAPPVGPSRERLLRAAERLQASELPQKLPTGADPELEQALIRGLAKARERGASYVATTLRGLGGVALPHGGAFERAAGTTVEALVGVELERNSVVTALDLIVALADSGLRIVDARSGDSITERFWLAHYSNEIKSEEWWRFDVACVRLDIELFNEFVIPSRGGARAGDGPAERFLRARHLVDSVDKVSPEDAGRVLKALLELLHDGNLGPRTQASALKRVVDVADLPVAEKIAILTHAADVLDPDSPMCAMELGDWLSLKAGRREEAIARYREALARFKRGLRRAVLAVDWGNGVRNIEELEGRPLEDELRPPKVD